MAFMTLSHRHPVKPFRTPRPAAVFFDVAAITLIHSLVFFADFGLYASGRSLIALAIWIGPIVMVYVFATWWCGGYAIGCESNPSTHARCLAGGITGLLLLQAAGLWLQKGPDRPMPLTVLLTAGIFSIAVGAMVRSSIGDLRRLIGNAIVAVISTGVAFVGLELAVRQIYQKPKSLAIPDLVLHHVHRPNSIYLEQEPLHEFAPNLVRFNALGLREDREINPQKAPEEYRVLLLGDSYIEARQVSYAQTMGQRLERLLNAWARQHGSRQTFTVINTGVGGYSPAVEYVYLKQQGLALHPDLVILYFVFNDVTDDYLRYRPNMEIDAEGLPVRIHPPTSAWKATSHHFIQSRTIELAHQGLSQVRQRIFGTDPKASPSLEDTFDFASATSLTKNALAIFKDRYDPVEQQAWNDTRHYLLGIYELLKQHEIPFVLAVIPAPPQVSADQWKVGKVKWGMKRDATIDSTTMQDILQDLAQQRGIAYLNLLPTFKAHAAQKLFYDYDGHWTVDGHQLAAQETQAFLLEHYLAQQLTRLPNAPTRNKP